MCCVVLGKTESGDKDKINCPSAVELGAGTVF